MAHKIYIGIDNGVTGTIAWMGEGVAADMIETPVKSEQSYTKEKKNITRIDYPEVVKRLTEITQFLDSPAEALAVIERPMINPMRFQASVSAARSLEATLIAIESLGIPRMYVDSRQWQKALLPHGCKGPELKHASADIGCRLFPDREKIIGKHKDADALLIAEWARREGL
jgi:hypothetical protein